MDKFEFSEKLYSYCKDAIQFHGKKDQLIKVAEELNELQTEAFQALKGKPDKNHMVEEIGDVVIMICQLKMIYGISDAEIRDWILFKIMREREKMQGQA